jgi:hypothetical protein
MKVVMKVSLMVAQWAAEKAVRWVVWWDGMKAVWMVGW